jgi:DNA/RNA endonuclease G (NUC1)
MVPNPLKDPNINITVPAATWKVALILNSGQGLQDITASTPTIAIITPNDTRPRNLGVDVPPLTDIGDVQLFQASQISPSN